MRLVWRLLPQQALAQLRQVWFFIKKISNNETDAVSTHRDRGDLRFHNKQMWGNYKKECVLTFSVPRTLIPPLNNYILLFVKVKIDNNWSIKTATLIIFIYNEYRYATNLLTWIKRYGDFGTISLPSMGCYRLRCLRII